MSWESEFASQWQVLLNSVETRLRRAANTTSRSTPASVNAVIQAEAVKWSTDSHYNGAWLKKLKRHRMALGAEFEATLKELRLERPVSLQPGVPGAQVALGIVVSLATFCALRWYQLPLLRQLIGTLAVAGITASILTSRMAVRKSKFIRISVERIRQHLQTTGEKLRDISRRADEVV